MPLTHFDAEPDQQYLNVYFKETDGSLSQYAVATDLPLSVENVEVAREAVELHVCRQDFTPAVLIVIPGGKAWAI